MIRTRASPSLLDSTNAREQRVVVQRRKDDAEEDMDDFAYSKAPLNGGKTELDSRCIRQWQNESLSLSRASTMGLLVLHSLLFNIPHHAIKLGFASLRDMSVNAAYSFPQ